MAIEISNLTVEGMSCSHCENYIKKSVGTLNGVYNVVVDIKSKKVSIEYDTDKVEIQTIKDTIEDQGYKVK
ncbi:MAG: copper ion binding protein [Clostridia bacterium]|nr:copper ion binding protein [Clostridia bacterium]